MKIHEYNEMMAYLTRPAMAYGGRIGFGKGTKYFGSNAAVKLNLKEYEKLILDSKNEAKSYFNSAREKIIKDVDKKKEKLEKEINEEINKAEKEILDLKNKSPEKINKIAIETSSDLIKRLIGVDVNKSSISAIVEDISRKTN